MKEDSKMLDKIDGSYLPSDQRIGLNDATPIWAKNYEPDGDEEMSEEEKMPSNPRDNLKYPKEYGTVTEYYFMLAETVHYGLMPIIKKGKDIIKLYEKLLEEKEDMNKADPQYNRMIKEFEKIQLFRTAYEITLFDKTIVKEIMNFFSVQFEMIKRWGKLTKEEFWLKQNPPTPMMRLVPEHYLTDVADFINYLLEYSRLGLKFFTPEDLFKIFEITIIIVRSPKAITNPHTSCKFIEIIYLIMYREKKVNWLARFNESQIMKDYLMAALLTFYVEIESGDNMYYQKFRYRYDCGFIFRRFWKLKNYKLKFIELVGTETMEKFINCLLNDTNHCLEEGISKLSKIKSFDERTSGAPTEEEINDYSHDQRACKTNFQLANECISMLKQITEWTTESFDNDIFASRMASSLNFVLNKIVGPQCIELKVKKPEKYFFKPIVLLSDLVTIYTNLGVIELFVNSVLGDNAFKMENIRKAWNILK